MTAVDCQPTWTPHGTDPAYQVEALEELHELACEGMPGRHFLGERFVALSMHQTVSPADMARVSGLSDAEVDQIIQERIAHHQFCEARAATDRIARHSPI
jgi:hypothetical protein